MKKREVQDILNTLKISPKKRLGQNFLIDSNIANKFIIEANLSRDDTVLEIGPGLGALTELLVKKAKKVYAVDIESKFCTFLSEKFSNCKNLEIIHGDILEIELPPDHNKVISNIPYSITGPLLEKVFYKVRPAFGVLTVDKKIGERMFLTKSHQNFSRISITLNSFMEPIKKYNISRNCFYPIPNIDLLMVVLKPKKNINDFLSNNKNIDYYLRFVAGIMPYKNKDLINALKLYLKEDKEKLIQKLQGTNFKNSKLFNLDIDDFINLSEIFQTQN